MLQSMGLQRVGHDLATDNNNNICEGTSRSVRQGVMDKVSEMFFIIIIVINRHGS